MGQKSGFFNPRVYVRNGPNLAAAAASQIFNDISPRNTYSNCSLPSVQSSLKYLKELYERNNTLQGLWKNKYIKLEGSQKLCSEPNATLNKH
jgi:hypothetical protein